MAKLLITLVFAATASAFQVPQAAPRALAVRMRPSQHFIVMEEEQSQKIIKTKSGLGRTVDQDGKSNVWAVEPKMRVEKNEMSLKDPKILAAVGALVLVIVGIPLLPTLFSGANGSY